MTEIKINLEEKHSISPYLYMQFMEPLGTADSSVDCAWDFIKNDWKPALIEKVKELQPKMVRFGGCFASYYRWKEAVGPFKSRTAMINYCWDGIYNNQVGTKELVDFCRRTDSEPLIVVNMESDGRMHWAYPENGEDRFGTAEEAAEWIDYCNNPENKLRISHGDIEPFKVKYWQIGNETSYDKRGYNSDKGVEVTKKFAEKMLEADNTVKLIAWGDEGSGDDTWCRKMSKIDNIDYLAFHHHFDSGLKNSPLRGTDYRIDPENTWLHLMNAYKSLENHIGKMRADRGNKRLVMTEGHYALPGRNRCEVLSSWGAGVSYARCLNVIMRNSDIIDIATMADFFGNVWQVNAILMTQRCEKAYFQPVATVMSLFSHHQGEKYLDIDYSGNIDCTASKTENKVYLHIANTSFTESEEIKLDFGGREIEDIKLYGVSENILTEITPVNMEVFDIKEFPTEKNGFILPKAAVAAAEIMLKP